MGHVALDIHLGGFAFAWLSQSDHMTHARIDPVGNGTNCSALAGGVAALEYNEHPLTGLLYPACPLVELLLHRPQVLGVFFLRQLAHGGAHTPVRPSAPPARELVRGIGGDLELTILLNLTQPLSVRRYPVSPTAGRQLGPVSTRPAEMTLLNAGGFAIRPTNGSKSVPATAEAISARRSLAPYLSLAG